MKPFRLLECLVTFLLLASPVFSADEIVSEATSECLDCHALIHPGIVQDWRESRHAKISPAAADAVQGPARKLSSTQVPEGLKDAVVGCAECHTLRPNAHADTFEHNGYDIHVVVSPADCGTCHSQEQEQYGKNVMAHAYANLADNPLYAKLQVSIIGNMAWEKHRLGFEPADDATRAEACYYCHGTRLKVAGRELRDTEIAGELEFPVIEGWPNQGVGRINLDGSLGSCAACHARHAFSMAMARKPYACKECHIGPDVPAFKVYTASKHGNIFSSMEASWDFNAVPWTIGKHFSAPTCAACHMSLMVNTEGEVVSERSHQMSDRLPWRIFGLVYAHPQPKNPDTTGIVNKDGQPLPTALDGSMSSEFLIDEKAQLARRRVMQAACLNCHDSSWVKTHWQRFEATIRKTNRDILTATDIVQKFWQEGYADLKTNPFDEAVEKQWTDTWQFYANSIRFASAMGGGGDYGVYADGRYQLSQTILEMNERLYLYRKVMQDTKEEMNIHAADTQ